MSRRKRRSVTTSSAGRSLPRRLLVPTALSVGALLSGCKDQPLPGNPKGSFYDEHHYGGAAPTAKPAGTARDTKTPAPDTEVPATNNPEADVPSTDPKTNTNTPNSTDETPPLPANPKGSWYDDGGFQDEKA